ncbi:hypothetical protein H4S07_005116, partial [Coemansia furcata]
TYASSLDPRHREPLVRTRHVFVDATSLSTRCLICDLRLTTRIDQLSNSNSSSNNSPAIRLHRSWCQLTATLAAGMLGTYQTHIGTCPRHLVLANPRNNTSRRRNSNSRGRSMPAMPTVAEGHPQMRHCAAVRYRPLDLLLLKMGQTRGGHSSSVPGARRAVVDISSGRTNSVRQQAVRADRLVGSNNRTNHRHPLLLTTRREVIIIDIAMSPKSSQSVDADYLPRPGRRPSRVLTKAESTTCVRVRSRDAALCAGRTKSTTICLGHRAVLRLCRDRRLPPRRASSAAKPVTGRVIALARMARVLPRLLHLPRDTLQADLPSVPEVRAKLEPRVAVVGDADGAKELLDLLRRANLKEPSGIPTLH